MKLNLAHDVGHVSLCEGPYPAKITAKISILRMLLHCLWYASSPDISALAATLHK